MVPINQYKQHRTVEYIVNILMPCMHHINQLTTKHFMPRKFIDSENLLISFDEITSPISIKFINPVSKSMKEL